MGGVQAGYDLVMASAALWGPVHALEKGIPSLRETYSAGPSAKRRATQLYAVALDARHAVFKISEYFTKTLR